MARHDTYTVKNALDAIMQERDWSQARLARWLGVSQSTISRWRDGSRRPLNRGVRLILLERGVDPRCL